VNRPPGKEIAMAKSTKTLHDAFIDELRDLYNAEKQITKALPKMIKAATAAPLADAFEAHLRETQGQIDRLEQVFESLDEPVKSKTCDGMSGILEEGKDLMGEDFDDATMDAVLIAAAQKVEHYEIGSYGTVIAWAEAMGHDEAARLLKETLEEEEAADEKLSSIATGGINEQAGSLAHGEDDEESDEGETVGAGAGRRTAPARGASRGKQTTGRGRR
jgi:ferritin-like metal-binding protein YciE